MSKGEVESLLSAQKIKIEEFEKKNILMPPVFAYISYKAAVFCVVGAVIYQKDDFFHYPLKEWNEDNIKKGCKQLLQNCSGVSPDYAVKDMSASDVRNMFELFHFTKTANEKTTENENIFRMDFLHKMDKRPFSVYYDLSNAGEEDPREYLSVLAGEQTVKLGINNTNGLIKIYTDDGQIGVGAEYAFVDNAYPHYKVKRQSLRWIEVEGKRTAVDALTLAGKDESKELRFDISDFYSC